MFDKLLFRSLSALAAAALLATAAEAVTIKMVPVGNPGNADDTHGNGYGGVDYVYNIGKYEVTVEQYTEFLNAVAGLDTHGLYHTGMWSAPHRLLIKREGSAPNYTYLAAPDRTNHPVNWINFWDAARFCNWLHNGQGDGDTESGAYIYLETPAFARQPGAKYFIPTEDEWYKAAYHKNDGVTGNYFDYPTSSDIKPSPYVLDPDPGNNATFWDGYGPLFTEVGEFENSESPYGTFHPGGWSSVLRGGSWSNKVDRLEAAEHWRRASSYAYNDIGFRVASVVPEPSTTLLGSIALFVLLAFASRRRKGSSGDSVNSGIPGTRTDIYRLGKIH